MVMPQSMFEAIKIVVALCVLGFAMNSFARQRPSMALRLLFILLFSRFVLASLHQYTYPPIVGPLSLISFASMASVALCFVALPLVKPYGRSSFVISKSLIAIYCLLVLMLVSAVVNGQLKAGLPSLIKWVYLLQLVILMGYALNNDGLKKTLRFMLVAYSFPIVMLLFSIVLGVSKKSELDGSTSFIGGFFHEAVFSTIVFTAAFFAATYARKFSKTKGLSILAVLLVSFVLMAFVNYRTAIIAFVAMATVLAFASFKRAGAPQKVFIGIGALCLTLWLASVDTDKFGDRFADLPNAFNNAGQLVTYPENYTRDDRRLFSGRIFMWSGYISEANAGSNLQILIGRGMGSWKDYFEKYAHNTFVSFYFELGLLGVFLCAAIFFGAYRRLGSLSDVDVRTCGLGFLFGFLILNFGTMPMWSMEGIYCLAFLIALARTSVTRRRSVQQGVAT